MRIGFDLDGTIIDCAPRQIGVMQEMMEKRKLPFAPDEFWQAKRSGFTNRRYLAERYRLAVADLDALDSEWLDKIESDAWLARDALLPNVENVLRGLGKAGHELLLLTARRSPQGVHDTLKRLRLVELFTAVEIVSPDKAAAAKGAILSRHLPAVYIGDTESDAEAALNAQVPFYAVMTGMRAESFLKTHRIARIFPSLGAAVDRALKEIES